MLSESLPAVNKPESLKDIAYRVIKEAILTLRFEPGQALSHRDLAAQLQISETPVRDALQELEREGFVTRVAHKGTFVTEIDPDDIIETFQIRTALEALAVRLAIPQLTDKDLDRMEQLLESAAEALAQGERLRCSQLGAEFHRCFLAKAHNHRLTVILDNIEDHTARFRGVSDLITGRLEKSQGEHRRLLEAARRRDSSAAEQAILAHLESVVADIEYRMDELP